MTGSALHDILSVAATALPVLYVPVVLVLLGRRTADGVRAVRPLVMLLYAIVFVNAELPALAGLAAYGAGDTTDVGLHGLLLLALVGIAVVFGLVLAFAPAADVVMAAALGASRRSIGQWVLIALIAIAGVALPVACSASFLHLHGWSARTVFELTSAIFLAVVLVSAVAERVRPDLSRVVTPAARMSASTRARSGVAQATQFDLERLAGLALRTRAALQVSSDERAFVHVSAGATTRRSDVGA